MAASTTETRAPRAAAVSLTEDALTVDLSDGCTISVPLTWFPRLTYVDAEERAHWELIGDGEGIHWPDLDEDISVNGLLAGRPSDESPKSFRRWLDAKRAGRPLTLDALRPQSAGEHDN
ncbi:MAG: DUF2442 domain-containing protein [Caldilineaceae bacterium]|nr:DUF2442 domain-containing protein [Caldilineaceae bacterium]